MPDGRRGKKDVRRDFFFSFFRSDKRKVPSSPRPPHIFNTRFVLHFFSFFFFFFFYLYAQARHEESRRARAYFVTVITFFPLAFSLSLSSSHSSS